MKISFSSFLTSRAAAIKYYQNYICNNKLDNKKAFGSLCLLPHYTKMITAWFIGLGSSILFHLWLIDGKLLTSTNNWRCYCWNWKMICESLINDLLGRMPMISNELLVDFIHCLLNWMRDLFPFIEDRSIGNCLVCAIEILTMDFPCNWYL